MKLYGHPLSGNVHRVEALLKLLGVEYELQFTDLAKGEHKSPEYLAINPLGQVPVLQDGDVTLRDSTAIMTYLCDMYDTEHRWLPADPVGRAHVQEWLSVAVNEVMRGPFTLRAIQLFGAPADAEAARAATENLFGSLFEPRLTTNDWLAGDSPTIADIACYSYLDRVVEGNFSLDAYPAIQAWIKRVEGIDGMMPMHIAADIFASANQA